MFGGRGVEARERLSLSMAFEHMSLEQLANRTTLHRTGPLARMVMEAPPPPDPAQLTFGYTANAGCGRRATFPHAHVVMPTRSCLGRIAATNSLVPLGKHV